MGASTAPLRTGALTAPLRLGASERLELPLTDERLGALERLELLLKLLRGELLDEREELPLKLLRLELLLDERLELLNELLRLDPPPDERLLLIELLWLPPPPPRLPPLRWANAGVALSAKAIMTRVIAFEVFILLLLSFILFSIFRFISSAKVRPFFEGNSEKSS